MMMMPIHGSTAHEAATTPEVEEDRRLQSFQPDFKEYVRKEQLSCSRCFGSWRCNGWVFWSQQDHQTQLDNYADLIRHTLQKLIVNHELKGRLFQFWAATKTSEGRTLLTTQFQPFAIASSYIMDETENRDKLCEYRMGMCREYNNSFYADADCPEQQLGLPGRVFLHQFPECTPYVKHCTLKEYPQRDLALRCWIGSSWAEPVFDHYTHACVGVLEIASPYLNSGLLHNKYFHCQMYDIFQEFGLLWLKGSKHYRWETKDDNKAYATAFLKLKTVLEKVCELHELPLAMTWVPCRVCNDLRKGVEFCMDISFCLSPFVEVSKCSHLMKQRVRRVFSSAHVLYCSDITQLKLSERSLLPSARGCGLGGWFAICLRNICTANDIFVVEFFFPRSNEYRDNSWTSLPLILGTLEENFRTSKLLASGQELCDISSVVVMDSQNGRKNCSVQKVQAIRFSGDPELHHGSPRDTDMVGSSRPLPGEDQEQDPSLNSDRWSDESTARICNMVTIKAKLQDYYTIKFRLSSSARFVELQQQVAKRLNDLVAGTYRVFYEDEENENALTLIACDEDLQEFLRTSISLGYTSVVVLLQPN